MSSTGAIPAASQAAQSVSSLGAQISSAVSQGLSAPGITRVAVPPRPADQPLVQPKKKAPALVPARDQKGGKSALATAPTANTAAGVENLGLDNASQGAAAQVTKSFEQLPQAHGLQRIYRTADGAAAYLDQETWTNHIVRHHITEPPNARGKRTTTWWPVVHANGAPSMNQDQVLDLIGEAIASVKPGKGVRGTQLIQHEITDEQRAKDLGVSEIKVSLAPDGKVLSAYPSRGENVLAVKEAEPQVPDAGSYDDPDAPVAAPGAASPTRFG
jgi:hypothetical protein